MSLDRIAYSTQEVAEMFGLNSRSTICDRINDGTIPGAYRLTPKGQWMIPAATVEKLRNGQLADP